MIEAQFHCAVCNEIAATLSVSDDDRFIQTGFLGNITEWVNDRQASSLRKVLQQASVERIYQLDALWAPFYCPTCRAVYCYQHWRMEIQFDDDFSGWYDCTYGTCPAGHRRMVDD